MTEITGGVFKSNELSVKSNGGTELMARRMVDRLPKELLKKFQIIHSRVRDLDESRVRILVLNDLPNDPESEHLKNEGWRKFHKLVFVSHWQMQAYMATYGIPWSHCLVMQNAIDPIETHEKPSDTINIIYTPTPQRGLNIAYAVFDKLCEKYENIHLDVFSSFNLYGWPERDKEFEELFNVIKKHPKITYHGTQSNDTVREALTKCHIFGYPSVWQETSCMCLMEAMSAGLVCVHSSLAALPETSANWTHMYQFQEDINQHANAYYSNLDAVINGFWDNYENRKNHLMGQKSYADLFYGWDVRSAQWIALLESMQDLPTEISQPQVEIFHYRSG